MKKIRASRQRLVAAFAMIALVLSVGIMDSRNTASAGDDEPDFLVLNPENE